MAPRGGKVSKRPVKKSKNLHPDLIMEEPSGPPPVYVQHTITPGPLGEISATSFIQSQRGSHSQSKRGSQSIGKSRFRGGISSGVSGSHYSESIATGARRGLVDEPTDSDGSDGSDEDVPTSDTVGDDNSVVNRPVRGEARPRSPPAPGSIKPKAFVYEKKLIGVGLERFWGVSIKQKMEGCWPHYRNISPDVKQGIWDALCGQGTSYFRSL